MHEYLFSFPPFGVSVLWICMFLHVHAYFCDKAIHLKQSHLWARALFTYPSTREQQHSCPQVSVQPEPRTSGRGVILSSSGDKSSFTQAPNFQTFVSAHAVCSSLQSHPFLLSILLHRLPLSHTSLIYSSFQSNLFHFLSVLLSLSSLSSTPTPSFLYPLPFFTPSLFSHTFSFVEWLSSYLSKAILSHT